MSWGDFLSSKRSEMIPEVAPPHFEAGVVAGRAID
jgi:hypothetical protein